MQFTDIKNFILSSGTGCSVDELTALDRALIKAKVSNYNLVKVSSILPPNCMLQDSITLSKGALLPSAFSIIMSNDMGTTISAAVAVGIPNNSNDIGVIMEHSAYDTKINTEKKARELVQQAMLDRNIPLKNILSVASECTVESSEFHCSFATLSMW